ncbi:MAG TPA: nuclear transport factor 2 family protein, partial [Gillisia sp.]|nr:nuclear transport factor 2 family protein [Gillisia sp.]
MGLSKKQEKEILQVYDTWMHSYLNGDVKTYDSYLDANYHFIGSTSNEEFLNKEATTHFFKTTADQLAGKTEIRNSVKTIEEIDGLIFITDLFDAYFLNNNDWTYYGRFRFTSALHKNKDGWRFVYQHFSMPDSKAEEGETIGYEQISLENLQLREAIKRRTVELEHKNKELAIEAALERVRARTMAMQKSEELAETSSLLFQQLKVLGINTYSSGFTIWDKAQNELISWMCNADGSINPPFRMPLTENTWHFDQYKNWKEGKEFALKDFTGEEMKSHFRYLQSFPLLDEAFKKSIAAGHPMPKRQVHHVANFSQGNLLFITLEPRPEAHDVFKRFAKVFEQTYTRFLDLQKAEEQAREANIEASLERVRSRSMAMHKTSELQEVINTVHQELLHLNISIYGGSFIAINKDIQDEIRCWGSGGTANTSEEVHIPLFEKPFYTNLIKGIKKGPGFFTEEYTQKEKKEFFTHLFKHQPWSELSSEEKKETLVSPGGYTRSCCVSKCTSIFIINHSGRKFTEAENEVLKRFAKVFEQTYTRFLDLQKAEAQAREAQIEAALEKVRSCSLAMHATEELQKVVTVVFEKMTELNIELDTININIFKAGSKEANLWTAAPNQKYATPFHLPFFDHPFHTDIFEAKEQGVDLFAKVYTFEEKNSYFNHTFLHSDFKHVPEEKKKIILEGKVCARSIAFTKDVAILLHRYYDTPFSDAENEILKRFTNVFQQAYTRFLDLQKAEAQAREAQIEAALERVRSRTMAMQKSDELHDTAKLLFQQIKSLGVPPWGCGFNIWEQGDKIFTSYMGGSEGTILAAFKIPLTEEAAFIHFQESRDRGDKLFADVLEGDAIKKHYEYFT